jgi:hypothetical protein
MANDWQMKGDYLKTCSCAPGCPCDFWAPPTEHLCEGVIALRISEGHFEKTPLNGLSWAVAFHWPGPLHLGNGTLQPYVDEKANEAQRNAILTILSGKAGGAWFEIVASLVSKVLPPKFVPIKFEFDLKGRRGKCVVANEVEAVAEPIKDINGNECQVRIEMPKGVEYFSAEVALAKVLKSTGPIKFNRTGVHSSFSAVNHSPAGLKA